jgi:hypothetical protein
MDSDFPLDYATETIQASQEGFRLTGTHQLKVFADDFYLLGVKTIGKSLQKLYQSLVRRLVQKETLKNLSTHMFISREQYEGQNNNIKIANTDFKNETKIKYF